TRPGIRRARAGRDQGEHQTGGNGDGRDQDTSRFWPDQPDFCGCDHSAAREYEGDNHAEHRLCRDRDRDRDQLAGERHPPGLGWDPVIGLTGGLRKPAVFWLAGLLTLIIVGALAAPMLLFASGGLMYSTGKTCSSGATVTSQPRVSTAASNSIPANYLALFKSTGARYKVPWVVLAGIA